MAAQWWEVTVPVAGAITSGLLGGWLGAHWQWRNSDRLLSKQFGENERARQAAAAEAAQARAEQLANDRALRLRDERRQVYARYLRLLDSYQKALARYATDNAEAQDLDEAEQVSGPEGWADRAGELRATESGKRVLDLADQLVEQTYELMFIASSEVGLLAVKLSEKARSGGDEADVADLWEKFLLKARKEIGAA
ncbi:hypothetical protein GCM10010169_63910 [Micromonospora fulviviridis]|uniref:hypothetical protein n=1 Tax=Micromonospora fulviviridis TaxID=47860 RepID=UPI001669FCB3|nr:hypothetical protein [Micromonospora fulviviridis]GGS10440.1 hypothetical protein GCM10010169_63910 [Micromonospora fulviviridis]